MIIDKNGNLLPTVPLPEDIVLLPPRKLTYYKTRCGGFAVIEYMENGVDGGFWGHVFVMDGNKAIGRWGMKWDFKGTCNPKLLEQTEEMPWDLVEEYEVP